MQGADNLLRQRPRPVVMAEVQDIRTNPWGYPAKTIIAFLSAKNFHWFRPLADGSLEGINVKQEEYDGNFVAVPDERLSGVRHLLSEENTGAQAFRELADSRSRHERPRVR